MRLEFEKMTEEGLLLQAFAGINRLLDAISNGGI